MIYTVECNFTNSASEAEWNNFYTLEKLPALISVSGFLTSQRFKALSTGHPLYLAIHSIENINILQSDEYRQKGGGNFSYWQQYITDWRRNLYEGLSWAPAISKDEWLVISTIGYKPLIEMGLEYYQLNAVALDKYPEHCYLAKLTNSTSFFIDNFPKGVRLYAPLTMQLTSI